MLTCDTDHRSRKRPKDEHHDRGERQTVGPERRVRPLIRGRGERQDDRRPECREDRLGPGDVQPRRLAFVRR
jgi:hypothetical protein